MNNQYPAIRIDLEKLQNNARVVIGQCAQHGVQVAAVVKCCCGSPKVARAFIAGGACQIADSRIDNLQRLREAGISQPLWMLRLPMPSDIARTVQFADLSLNSSPEVLEMLSEEALRQHKIHQVLLMVDLGDRREGVLPGDVPAVVAMIRRLKGIYLTGLGTNLTCFGGIIPDAHNMELLAETVRKIRCDFHEPLHVVSAGNSSSLNWMLEGKMPPEVNHLRLGESLLLGRETADGRQLDGTCDDAFMLEAEVIEAVVKPSMPQGTSHRDAFGNLPTFKDQGIRKRAIFGIGREDVPPDGLTPADPNLKILGASSDHLIADVEDCTRNYQSGDLGAFKMDYAALLATMTSAYVSKKYLGEQKSVSKNREFALIGADIVSDDVSRQAIGAAQALLEEGGMLLPDATKSLVDNHEQLKQAFRAATGQGRIPIVIGGDSTVLTTLEPGHGNGLVVFSAFGDFNDARSSGTTRCGMSLAALCGKPTGGRFPLLPPFPERNIAHIGLRTTDPRERQLLRESPMTLFTMEQVDLLGMREVIRRTLDILDNTTELVVAISLSVLDPLENPGATQSVSAGLSLREMYCAMELLADSGWVAGAMLYDCTNQTGAIKTAVHLLSTLFGKKII